MLNRLIEDPQALGQVAREALGLMHFDKVDEAIAAGDATLSVRIIRTRPASAAATAACCPTTTSPITR